jgi:hypothetical protein
METDIPHFWPHSVKVSQSLADDGNDLKVPNRGNPLGPGGKGGLLLLRTNLANKSMPENMMSSLKNASEEHVQYTTS